MADPTQVGNLLDQDEPAGEERYRYYLLEPRKSPPISVSDAVSWQPYEPPKYLYPPDVPYSNRVAFGEITYAFPLTWAQLAEFNLLPVEEAEAYLYDLWREFGRDIADLIAFFEQVTQTTTDDPELRRLRLAIKLISQGWNLAKISKILTQGPAAGEGA
jgi:hypothetical protein